MVEHPGPTCLGPGAVCQAQAVPPSVIDAEQRQVECDALMDAAVGARNDDAAHVDALRACLAHPCAYHEFDTPELYQELGWALCHLGRFDESLDAMEAAIRAGARSVPHPRAEVAEVLVSAGRRAEADKVFADLRERCPDDVWLRNAAGFCYSRADDPTEALVWLDEGIVMALDDGDPERIVEQLADERRRCRQVLGLGDDDLTARVAGFERSESRRTWSPGADDGMFSEADRDRSPCPNCGWSEEQERATEMSIREVEQLSEVLEQLRKRPRHTRAPGDAGRWSGVSVSEPIRVEKIGRNAPCPCGSGRKHKQCCGA